MVIFFGAQPNSAIAIHYLVKQQMVLKKRLYVDISLVLVMKLQLMNKCAHESVGESLCEQLAKFQFAFMG